jgi:hypothetical protein
MSWNQAHAPLLVKSFPKTPRTQSEASQVSGSHNYRKKNKTNYLPSKIDGLSPIILSRIMISFKKLFFPFLRWLV